MSILSLRDISGSYVLKNIISVSETEVNPYRFILFKQWEEIRCSVPLRIKNAMLNVEREALQGCSYPIVNEQEENILIEKIDQLFINLCKRLDVRSNFQDIVPITSTSYLLLHQIWADEALAILWNEISKKITLPGLVTPEERRCWLKHSENAQQLSQITELRLWDSKLKVFPIEVQFCTGLQTLFCENSQIAEIPEDLDLPKLRWLYLDTNCISLLPNFKKLPELRVLCLKNNRVSNLPDFTNLRQLRVLELDNNLISHLPDFTNLPSLMSLYMKNNQVSIVPNFTNLPFLHALHLDDNRISVIPNFINLLELTSLSLSGNQISIVPNFPHLVDMQELNLSYNQIENVPDLTHMDNLRILKLKNNKILNHPNYRALLPQLMTLEWDGENAERVARMITYASVGFFLMACGYSIYRQNGSNK